MFPCCAMAKSRQDWPDFAQRVVQHTNTCTHTLRVLHHPGLYKVFEIFCFLCKNQSTVYWRSEGPCQANMRTHTHKGKVRDDLAVRVTPDSVLV